MTTYKDDDFEEIVLFYNSYVNVEFIIYDELWVNINK